jgi:hypothetical protein
VSARVAAIGLVDAYIESNPTKSGVEVAKWWKQKKEDYKAACGSLSSVIGMTGDKHVS